MSGTYVKGEGPLECKLMIVAEAPGEIEERYGRPLIGPTGELLNELLKEANIRRDECYVTNVVKYRPPFNDFKRLHEIGVTLQESINNLWQEIRSVRPNCILALGDKALLATTNKQGINNYRGSILQSKDGLPKVVSTFHPSNLLYQKGAKGRAGLFKYAWKYVMIADMKRAREQSEFRELKLPVRHLEVVRDSLKLYRFLRENENRDIFVEDVESFNSIPFCVGISFDKYHGISVPLYRKFFGNKLTDASDSEIFECWKLIAQHNSKKTGKLIGQNFKYDDEKEYRLGLRPRHGVIYADTLSLEHTLNPELPSKKLSVISSIRTEEPYYKDEGSEYHPEKDDVDRVLLYNAKDCVVTYECWEDQDKELRELAENYSPKIYSFYYDYVAKLHPLYLEMERIGIKVDLHIRRRLEQKYTAWHNRIQRWFVKNTGATRNVYSYKTLYQYIYGELGIPPRKDTGEDTLVQVMNNVIKDQHRKDILSNILDDRRVRKANSTYVKADLDYDNRLRTSYFITGTETGRSTTNLLENPIRPKGHSVGLAFQTITKHGDIGADVRRMLVPDDGYVFLSCDLSQAEARIVSVLCEDWELLKAFDTIDIHRRTAGLVFDMVQQIELSLLCSNPLVDQLGKDSGERFLGKKTRHAGNYNMGPERHHKDAHAEARRAGIKLDLSEYKANRNLNKFHDQSPKIRGVFHKQIQYWINKQRFMVNPYGRIRFFLDRLGEEMYREAYAWIPQSTVHDTLTLGAERIFDEQSSLRFVMEGHDSLTWLCPKAEVELHAMMIKKHLNIEIDFSFCTMKRDIKLIIPCDFEVGEKNLKDQTKLKVN